MNEYSERARLRRRFDADPASAIAGATPLHDFEWAAARGCMKMLVAVYVIDEGGERRLWGSAPRGWWAWPCELGGREGFALALSWVPVWVPASEIKDLGAVVIRGEPEGAQGGVIRCP